MEDSKVDISKSNFTVCPECKKKYPLETVGKRVPICDRDGNKVGDFEICVCETCYQIYKLRE